MRVADQIVQLEYAFLESISSHFPSILSPSENANLHAFLVLSHAVLEEDIESAFEEYFDELAQFLGDERVPLAGLMLAYAVGEQAAVEDKVPYKSRNTILYVQNQGRKFIEKIIRANNGLKEQNLEKLAKSVGVHWEDFEQSLSTAIADLNTFGGKRGSSSHLSPFSSRVTSITDQLDPEDVKRWVQDAVNGASAVRAHLKSQIPSIDKQIASEDGRRWKQSAIRARASRAVLRG